MMSYPVAYKCSGSPQHSSGQNEDFQFKINMITMSEEEGEYQDLSLLNMYTIVFSYKSSTKKM